MAENNKQFSEALAIADKIDTLQKKIYGGRCFPLELKLCQRRLTIFTEMDGQEQMAEKYAASYRNMYENLFQSLDASIRAASYLRLEFQKTLFSNFLDLKDHSLIKKI